jgi:hypothetical protein
LWIFYQSYFTLSSFPLQCGQRLPAALRQLLQP